MRQLEHNNLDDDGDADAAHGAVRGFILHTCENTVNAPNQTRKTLG